MSRSSSGIYSQSVIEPNFSSGGAPIGIGTPILGAGNNRFLLTDNSSSITTDAGATRDSSTFETHLQATFGNGLFDLTLTPTLAGVAPFSGSQLNNGVVGENCFSGVADLSGFGGSPVVIIDGLFGTNFQFLSQVNTTSGWNADLQIPGFTIGLGLDLNTFQPFFGDGTRRYFLPANVSAPNLNDVLTVVNVSGGGSQIFCDFAPGGGGGGSPAGPTTAIQFNAGGGSFGGSNNFRFKDSNREFIIGDPTLSFNQNVLLIDDSTNQYRYQMGPSGTNRIVDELGNYYFECNRILGQTGIGDTSSSRNQNYLIINDTNNSVIIHGFRLNGISSVTPGGGNTGPNDLTPSPASSYTGNNTNLSYFAEIVSLDCQELVGTIVGGTGVINAGDVLTNGVITGTVSAFFVSSGGHLIVENVTGGVFGAGAVLTCATNPGMTYTLGFPTPFLQDAYIFQNGPSTIYGLCTTSFGPTFQGIGIQFGATNGHGLADTWSWNYGVSWGDAVEIDNQNQKITSGDCSLISNGTRFQIDVANNTISAIVNDFQVYNSSSSNVAAHFNTNLIISVIGDYSNNVNGTKLWVDDPTQLITAYTNGGFVVQNNIGHRGLNIQTGTGGYGFGQIDSTGNNCWFEINDSTQNMNFHNVVHFNVPLASYVNDAAAGAGGLVAGDQYQQTGTGAVYVKQ